MKNVIALFLFSILFVGGIFALPKVSSVESIEINQVLITFTNPVDFLTPIQTSYFYMGELVPASTTMFIDGSQFIATWDNPMPIGEIDLVIGEQITKIKNVQPITPNIKDVNYNNGGLIVSFLSRIDPVSATSVNSYKIETAEGKLLNPSQFMYNLDWQGHAMKAVVVKDQKSVVLAVALPPGSYMITIKDVRSFGGTNVSEFPQRFTFLVK